MKAIKKTLFFLSFLCLYSTSIFSQEVISTSGDYYKNINI